MASRSARNFAPVGGDNDPKGNLMYERVSRSQQHHEQGQDESAGAPAPPTAGAAPARRAVQRKETEPLPPVYGLDGPLVPAAVRPPSASDLAWGPAASASPATRPLAVQREPDELLTPDFDGKPAAGEEQATGTTPLPGDTGILMGDVTTKVGNADTHLAAGTVVMVVGGAGDKLRVTLYSGYNGQEAVISKTVFQSQPGVALEHGKGVRDDIYQQYEGLLWGKDGPKVDDVSQGMIGDCYLIAAMMSVVARDAGAIKKLFSPHTPNQKSYRVTLYRKNGKISSPTRRAW